MASAGFNTEVATDVKNSHHSLSGNSDLDVILCEMDLKGVSWGEARRTLREMDVQVPAIMFSDVAETGRMMTALRLGASDFFLRPVEDKEALVRSIQRCVRQRQVRRELFAMAVGSGEESHKVGARLAEKEAQHHLQALEELGVLGRVRRG